MVGGVGGLTGPVAECGPETVNGAVLAHILKVLQ
jgi:hypothetical protein